MNCPQITAGRPGATLALTVLAAGAFVLSACDRNGNIGGGGHGDTRICTPFASQASTNGLPSTTVIAADPSQSVDDCLHRWAYTLAGGKDTADVVARGVTAACAASLSTWNQQVMGQGGTGGDALSLTTGQPIGPIGAHAEFAQSRALFYVVQARAGNCPAPAIDRSTTTTGGPAGANRQPG